MYVKFKYISKLHMVILLQTHFMGISEPGQSIATGTSLQAQSWRASVGTVFSKRSRSPEQIESQAVSQS